MEQLEKVEKLREKTGVTYEEAKAALEACEWDLLDAIVYLESQGKIKDAGMASYTTKSESSEEFKQAAKDYEDNSNRVTLGEMVDKFLKWCGKIIKKGCDNYFEVYKDGKIVINAPVIVLVILLIVAFWVTLSLLVIGLFFGFRYSFRGEITNTVDINSACDKAAETCENIKNDFSGKKNG